MTQKLLTNPGYLKLELLTKGIKLSRTALESEEIKRTLAIAGTLGSALELDLVLPENVLVNIPIQECLAADRPYTLTKDDGRFYIETEAVPDTDGAPAKPASRGKVEAWVVPPPAYYDRRTSSGVPLADIGRVYAGYLAITPIPTCEFISENLACRYCDVPGRGWPERTVDEVLETVEAALDEGAAEYVCLNVGYATGEDGGIARLEPYVRAIKERYNVLVCVQAQPPKDNHWIDLTYAMGVDSLAYNLEVYNPERFATIAPGKMKLVGRDRYLEALSYATKVFPAGAVVSNLIVGLEAAADTIKGIDALTAMGVIPTLPIFRPQPGEGAMFSAEDIAEVFRRLPDALRRHRLSPSWISHFNMVVNAMDGHFFGGQAPLKRRWQQVFKSKHGGRLAHGISNFRRRLRVRPSEDEASEGH